MTAPIPLPDTSPTDDALVALDQDEVEEKNN